MLVDEDFVVAASDGLEEVLPVGEVTLVEDSQSSHSIEKLVSLTEVRPGRLLSVELVLVVVSTGFVVMMDVLVDASELDVMPAPIVVFEVVSGP